jgi:hypothetical protein
MRRTLQIGLVIFVVVIVNSVVAAQSQSLVPVVAELFTSEGCSSCPPADQLFADLQKKGVLGNAELILLGEHVDYWNDLGWKDRFSSRQFSNRQAEYARVLGLPGPYTPQVVINGHTELVGNDANAVTRAIAAESKSPRTARVSLQWLSDGKLSIDIQNAEKGSRAFLALTQDGLTTRVDAGENGGRILNHFAVVRELRELPRPVNGVLKSSIAPPATAETRDINHVLVFVQRSDWQISGAAKISRISTN